MDEITQKLFLSEQKAKELFKAIEDRGLIIPGKSEKQLCDEIVQIARDDFGTEDHWGKKIVRTGINTCLLYTSPSPRDGLLSRMPSSA